MGSILSAVPGTGLDAETFHTYLHLLTIVLLVYLVRSVTKRP